MRVQLGDKVQDTVTGLKGIATARTVWLNGCVRINFEWSEKGEAKSHSADEVQLRVLKAGVVKSGLVEALVPDPYVPEWRNPSVRAAGGGRPEPARRPSPRR